MPKLPPNTYWNARAEQRMDAYLRGSEDTLRVIGGAFGRATQTLEADIERIYGAYAKRHSLTPEQAKSYLAQPVPYAEYERLLAQLPSVTDPARRQELLARINAPAAAYRMSRLEALQANIALQVGNVTEVQTEAATSGFRRTIEDAYSRTLYDIQRGTGYGWRVDALSPGAIQTILRNPWSGENYSARIWHNQAELAKWLEKDLTAGMLAGTSSRRLAQDLRERMGVGYGEAVRLVRTETCYMANAGEMQGYIEAGITKYRFLATLDNRTSRICGELDGEEYLVSEAVPGKNMPPMHPHCRSTTIAVFDDMTLEGLERRARDPLTGEVITVPADMTYKEWETTFTRPSFEPAQVPRFVFQAAQSIKEANEYAQKVLGIPAANYKGISIEAANEWNRGLTDHWNKYPALRDNFVFTGECHERNAYVKPLIERDVREHLRKLNPHTTDDQLDPWVKKGVQQRMARLRVSKDTYAQSWKSPLAGGVTINRDSAKNAESMVESLRRDVAVKFHPVGCDTIRSVLDHEVGHQLDDLLGLSAQEDFVQAYAKYSTDRAQLTEDLSRYAWDNQSPKPIKEFIAEAFAEYCNNPSPRPVARWVGQEVERRYGAWSVQSLSKQ